jgi:small subunit ribosomal protein S21
VILLPGIILRDGDAFEDAYRRFKKQCDRNLIVTETKARRYFESNPEIKKKEKIAARKKILKKMYMMRRYESRL